MTGANTIANNTHIQKVSMNAPRYMLVALATNKLAVKFKAIILHKKIRIGPGLMINASSPVLFINVLN